MIKLAIDRNSIDDMLSSGKKLHGHAGPYLNLGIKMGLAALEILDAKGYFDLTVKAELKYQPPVSCLIDGLQISTGCTMGKGNIDVRNNLEVIKVFFESKNKSLLVFLKPEITKLLDFEKDTCEDLGQQILAMSDEELFIYQ